MESIEAGQAQRVGSADQGRIDEPRFDHASRGAEHLGARRARRGNGHGRALESAPPANIVRDREGVVGGAVYEISRQRAADRIAGTISQFCLHDARGTGADKYTDPAPAPARRRGIHSIQEAVLTQGKLGQAVVAAVEQPQFSGQALYVDSRHRADMRVETEGFKVAVRQYAGPLIQAGQYG